MSHIGGRFNGGIGGGVGDGDRESLVAAICVSKEARRPRRSPLGKACMSTVGAERAVGGDAGPVCCLDEDASGSG